jgi:type IV pilus assembly protein PilE
MFCSVNDQRSSVRAGGFSLIEIMVVVAIVAILAALAIPAYGRYAYRAHRADGQGLLLRIADAEERFYAGNNHYGALSEIGFADPAISEQRFYSAIVDISGDSADSRPQVFTAAANPVGVQSKDACGVLTISNAGIKTPAAASPTSDINGPCW